MEIKDWKRGTNEAVVILNKKEIEMLGFDFDGSSVGKGLPRYNIKRQDG